MPWPWCLPTASVRSTRRSSVPWRSAARSGLVDILLDSATGLVECQLEIACDENRWRRTSSRAKRGIAVEASRTHHSPKLALVNARTRRQLDVGLAHPPTAVRHMPTANR